MAWGTGNDGPLIVVRPYFENFGKRLVKTPKMYLADTGLLCYLLGLESMQALERSPFIGAVFEAFVAQEIVKHQIHHGERRELYYFRDEQGLEIDFVVPRGTGLELVESKWSKTLYPRDARPIQSLQHADSSKRTRDYIVHRGSGTGQALAAGVRAVTFEQYLEKPRH